MSLKLPVGDSEPTGCQVAQLLGLLFYISMYACTYIIYGLVAQGLSQGFKNACPKQQFQNICPSRFSHLSTSNPIVSRKPI